MQSVFFPISAKFSLASNQKVFRTSTDLNIFWFAVHLPTILSPIQYFFAIFEKKRNNFDIHEQTFCLIFSGTVSKINTLLIVPILGDCRSFTLNKAFPEVLGKR